MLEVLQEVLDKAHNGHVYVRDIDKHGKLEDWRIELVGDCDSFALWCRDELKKHDIESDLVYCLTETGEGHLVCSVDGYILDNRYVWVMAQQEMPYTWLKLGKPDGSWHIIKARKD